jgi:hypothetical protein
LKNSLWSLMFSTGYTALADESRLIDVGGDESPYG